MKYNILLICSAFFIIAITGCNKSDDSRVVDYFVEFATVLNNSSTVTFQLDNRQILTPNNSSNFSDKKNGQRVILNYTPLDNNVVQVNRATDVFTSQISLSGFPEKYFTDAVKIQSIWVGGNYLNLILEVEYHDKSHSSALYIPNPEEPDKLYLSYSRNEDPAGYPQTMYMSFSLEELKNRIETFPFTFTLYINTNDGMRSIELQLK